MRLRTLRSAFVNRCAVRNQWTIDSVAVPLLPTLQTRAEDVTVADDFENFLTEPV